MEQALRVQTPLISVVLLLLFLHLLGLEIITPRLQHRPGYFQGGAKTSSAEHEALQGQLYEQIGRLKTELDWLKKKAASFG